MQERDSFRLFDKPQDAAILVALIFALVAVIPEILKVLI